MVYVGNAVAKPHDGRLARIVGAAVCVVQDAHARLIAQVPPSPVALEHVHHAQALLIVLEAAGVNAVQRPLARVAEGRVPQIMPERGGLGKILVQRERPRHRTCKAADLKRVRQACAVMVALRLKEHLCLMLQTAEGLGVRDPVNVALEAGAYIALRLRQRTALTVL